MLISFIIPSYKAVLALDSNLGYLMAYLSEKDFKWEVLVVDDGSDDGGATEKVALKYGCSYEGYGRNKGKGGAVRHGMKVAKGDIKIFTDADIPFEHTAVDRIIESITVQNFDLVIGDRTLDDSVFFTKIKKTRKLGSNIYTFLVGRIITTGVFDTQCGLKGFKSKVADDIFNVSKIESFAFDVELIYIALKRNYTIRKIPVRLRSQEGDSVSLMRHAPGMLLDLFKIKINHMEGLYKKRENYE